MGEDVVIPLDLSDDAILVLAKEAHRQNITLNQLMVNIIEAEVEGRQRKKIERKELRIDITGKLGSGKTLIAAVIFKALQDAIVDCSINVSGEDNGRTMAEAFPRLGDLPTKSYFPYDIEIISHTSQ
jgi:pantothenate kinase-related protein Tda10